MMERLFEQAALVGGDAAVVVGHPTEVGRVLDVGRLEQTGGHEAPGADEVHVACEGRGGRIGRAAPPHGPKGHGLPEGLAGDGEEIDEAVGFLTEVAGAEGPRERSGMEKNPARALEFHAALGVEGCGAVRTQARSTSATLQAWATQPRGVYGSTASNTSPMLPMQASSRCGTKPARKPRAHSRSSGCTLSHASTNGPMSHAHTVP